MTEQHITVAEHPVSLRLAETYFLLVEYSDETFDRCPDLYEHRARVYSFLIAIADLYVVLCRYDWQRLSDEEIQYYVYEIGKKHFGEDKKELRDFFRLFYYAVLQQPSGSRIGQMINVLGLDIVYDRIVNNIYGAVL